MSESATVPVPGFAGEVLALFDEYEMHDELHWRRRAPGEFKFFVNVGDVFWWGTADAEEITPDSIVQCRKAFEDADAAMEFGHCYGIDLFAARVRGMRPQGAVYKNYPKELWPLLDACGPEREINVCNPIARPSDAAEGNADA